MAIPTLIDILQSPVEGEKHYLNLTGNSSPSALGLMAPILRSDQHGAYTNTRDMETMYMIAALASFGTEASEALPVLREIRDNQQTLPANRTLATKAIQRIGGDMPN